MSYLENTAYELPDNEEEERRPEPHLPVMGTYDTRTSSEENGVSIEFDVYHNDVDDGVEKQKEGSAVVSV